MPAYIKSVTFDRADALVVATFWAAALGTDMGRLRLHKAYLEAPAGLAGAYTSLRPRNHRFWTGTGRQRRETRSSRGTA